MSQWNANPDIMIREEDEGLRLAFNTATGTALILNPTAFFIWSRAAEGRTTRQIADALTHEFDFRDEAPTVAALDAIVDQHVALLLRRRLLVDALTKVAARTDDAEIAR